MNKKVFLLLSIFILLFSFKVNAYASDNVLNIDLKSAVDRALKKSPDLDLIAQKISLAKDKCSEDTDDITKRKNEKELEDLLWQQEDTNKTIERETTRLYFQILIYQKQIDLQKDIILRLNKEYDSKKKQVELGKDVAVSLLNCESNIMQAESKLLDLQNLMDNAVMDLNIEMGDDVNQKLLLADEEIPEDSLNISDIDAIAEKLPDLSHSVTTLIKDKSITYDEYNDAKGYDRDTYKDKLITLEYDIDDEKNNVVLNVYSGYNDILNLKDQMDSKKLDLDRYKKLEDASKIKFDYGLISSIDHDKARQDALNAEYQYLQSKLDYYVEIKKYKDFIDPVLEN